MKKIGLYFRVSTDQQSYAMQRKAIYGYIDSLDIKPQFIKHYQDTMSGSADRTHDRTQYLQLLDDCKTGKIDTIICYSVDRFSRSSRELFNSVLDLVGIGIQVQFIKQRYLDFSDSNPFRQTMLAMFGDFAQLEREMITTRVKDGLAQAKAKGIKLGKRPLDDQLIQNIKHCLKAGWTVAQISKELKVSESSIYRIKRTAK